MPSIIKELIDRNRLLGVLAGILIGALACAWLSFAVLPAEVFFKGASPRLLKASEAGGKTIEYRDLYVVNVARRYQQGLGNPAVAFNEASNALGLNSGDVNKEVAAQMVQNALEVVKAENSRDKDGGYFNTNDELALSELLKGVNGANIPDPNANVLQRLVANRNLWLGFLGLLLAIPLILLGLGYLTRLSMPVNMTASATRATAQNAVQPPEDVIDEEAAALTAPPPGAAPASRQPAQNVWEEPPENEFSAPAAPAAAAIPTMDTFDEQEQVDLPPAKPVTGAAAAAAAATAVAALNPSPAVILPQAQPASGGFAANYTQGDDMFDQDFAISGPKGELNGECGVSIADRLGADSPARVDALSVWVFDKADFKSVTKIIATDHAMNTPAIRAKLAQKGEVIRATDNLKFDIITSRLHVVVHVTDVLLNEDDPPNSCFKNARVNFIVQRKANEANVSM